MKLAHPFPTAVRELFRDEWACWRCGGNGAPDGGLELNHIFGRISGSALNASLLCTRCHGHIGHSREEHHELLRKAITYLARIGYKLQQVDHEFLLLVQNELIDFVL